MGNYSVWYIKYTPVGILFTAHEGHPEHHRPVEELQDEAAVADLC